MLNTYFVRCCRWYARVQLRAVIGPRRDLHLDRCFGADQHQQYRPARRHARDQRRARKLLPAPRRRGRTVLTMRRAGSKCRPWRIASATRVRGPICAAFGASGRDLPGASDATVLGILGIPARLSGGPRFRLRSFMGGLRQLVDAFWIPRSDSRRAGTGLSPRAPHPWRPQRADTAPDAPFRRRLPPLSWRCRPRLSRISPAESLRRARPLPSDRDRHASSRRAAPTCRPWAPGPVSAANPQSRATSAACSWRR